jgi:hypothetical protein
MQYFKVWNLQNPPLKKIGKYATFINDGNEIVALGTDRISLFCSTITQKRKEYTSLYNFTVIELDLNIDLGGQRDFAEVSGNSQPCNFPNRRPQTRIGSFPLWQVRGLVLANYDQPTYHST